MNVENLIGEATEYDKKLALEVKRPKSWCKSVSAFANTLGGALVFGISDDDEIVGLTDPNGDAEKLSEIIKTRMEPIPEFRLRFHKTEDAKVLLILDIFKGEETPYYYSGDGILEAYIRVGNESVKATSTELKRLVLRGRNTSFDSQLSAYRVEDSAFSKLRERYKKWTGSSFDTKDLISFGLASEDGYLTNAGALIADESPIRWSRLFCTRWNGLDKSGGTMDALDDAEYSGSVISLIENGEAFVKRNARMKWRKTANSREEMPEYVERSYHEALVNALAHRDYLVNGSEVHIDIYDDRMEFISLGGLVKGLTLQDIQGGASQPRNMVIANIFYRLDLIESYGTGIQKIMESYASCADQPVFSPAPASFVVTLPNRNRAHTVVFDATQTYEENILNLLQNRDHVTRKEVEQFLGCSAFPATNALNSLIREGKIVKTGTARGTRYILADQYIK